MTSAYETGQVPPIQVHHRLRIAREWAGLEQGELADRIGISRQSVGSAERGRSHPRRITLNAWALACGVPVSWLTTGQTPSGGDGGDSMRPEGPGPLTGWFGPDTGNAPNQVIPVDFRRPTEAAPKRTAA